MASSSPESQLWTACTDGNTHAFETLMAAHPTMDLNWFDPEFSRTCFYRCPYLLNPPSKQVSSLKSSPLVSPKPRIHPTPGRVALAEQIW